MPAARRCATEHTSRALADTTVGRSVARVSGDWQPLVAEPERLCGRVQRFSEILGLDDGANERELLGVVRASHRHC